MSAAALCRAQRCFSSSAADGRLVLRIERANATTRTSKLTAVLLLAGFAHPGARVQGGFIRQDLHTLRHADHRHRPILYACRRVAARARQRREVIGVGHRLCHAGGIAPVRIASDTAGHIRRLARSTRNALVENPAQHCRRSWRMFPSSDAGQGRAEKNAPGAHSQSRPCRSSRDAVTSFHRAGRPAWPTASTMCPGRSCRNIPLHGPAVEANRAHFTATARPIGLSSRPAP